MTKLDILGTTWELVETDELPSETMLGFMDAIGGKLLIREDVFPDWKLYLLIHELLHAFIFLGHLQFLKYEDSLSDNEGSIDALASLIADFIVKNKGTIDHYTQEV